MRTPGFYTTLGLGIANTHYSDALIHYQSMATDLLEILIPVTAPSDNNFAGKLTLGYVLDKYISTELTYYNFSGASVDISSLDTVATTENYSVTQRALSTTVVGHLPVGQSALDVFAKAGLAYSWATMKIQYSSTGSGPSWAPNQLNYSHNFSASSVAPVFGLGLDYNFSHHWAMSMSWVKVYPLHRQSFGDPLNTEFSAASLWSIAGTYKF